MAVNYSGSSPITFFGVISGTGVGARLIKEGTGTLVLSGNNTYQGATNVDNGTLKLGGSALANQIDDSSALFVGGSGIFDLDGRFERVGGLSGSGQVDLGNPGSSLRGLAVVQSGTSTFFGVISGTGTGARLVKEGTGTLILTGVNTHEGGTDVNGGTLQVSNFLALGQQGVGLRFDGGTLRTTANNFGTSRAVTLNTNGGKFNVDSSTTLELNGAIGGTGPLTKFGGGTLILGGNNTYQGATIVDNGTLKFDGSTTGGGDLSNSADGTVVLLGGSSFVNDLQIANAGQVDVQLGASISGVGSFTQTAGSTVVDGTMTQASILINGGTLGGTGIINGDVQIGASGTLGPGNSPGSLTIDGGFTLAAGAFLALELGRNAPGQFDQLLVQNGIADLLGEIQISFIDGYLPAVNDTFTLITASSFTPASSLVAFSFFGGNPGPFETIFSATTLSIVFNEVTAPIPIPAALPMLLVALLGFGIVARRRSSAAA